MPVGDLGRVGTGRVQAKTWKDYHEMCPAPKAIIADFETMGREKATQDKQIFSVADSKIVSGNVSGWEVAIYLRNQFHSVAIDPAY